MINVQCAVPGCLDEHSSRHFFPDPRRDLERFLTWVEQVDPELRQLDPISVYKTKRVCHTHFLPEHISRSCRLYKIATPQLKLANQRMAGESISEKIKRMTEEYAISSRKCTYKSCVIKNCKPNESTYGFPNLKKRPEMYWKWMDALKDDKLSKLDPEIVRRKKRICKRHFESKHINIHSNRLFVSAVPTLFLNGACL